MSVPEPSFEHIARLTDSHGTFEHARHTEPRRQHGYCTDDMARLLVVTSREPQGDHAVQEFQDQALRFVIDAQDATGKCRNRKSSDGKWHGPFTTEDSWGRSLWGLGTAAARSESKATRDLALVAFDRGSNARSDWTNAMAFAALGAAEVLSVAPHHIQAQTLMLDASNMFDSPRLDTDWPWPEPRLTYANAIVPEVMIATGVLFKRPGLTQNGLDLLAWLLERETYNDHLSVTPVGGAGPDDSAPAFDQQPIEVACLADACNRAALVDGSSKWVEGLRLAVNWFLGDNDSQTPMWEPQSGGGYDGLQEDGPNINQGAESTLALISTLQHARYS